jgi:hypothetical protein
MPASEKVAQESVRSLAGTAAGSMRELPAGSVTEPPKRSLCVKEPQDLGAGGTEAAVPGRVFGEGRGEEGCRLVGNQAAPSISFVPW